MEKITEFMEKTKEAGATEENITSSTIIYSPITGYAGDISTTPDEVFSQKMMGDGAVLTPSEALIVAPTDGMVEFVFETKHAIGFRTADDVGILIHIGIDTVKLAGAGFEVLVTDGQDVKKGDALIKVDLTYVGEHAPSLATPIICTELNENQSIKLLKTGEIKTGEPLFAVETKA
ncbi:MAG: PTS glucose transporter subunit IIA [Phascolarctobacterium sp.]|nr:PTS glucose transporter subunit IIA [Phascolarctobacterium sp.]